MNRFRDLLRPRPFRPTRIDPSVPSPRACVLTLAQGRVAEITAPLPGHPGAEDAILGADIDRLALRLAAPDAVRAMIATLDEAGTPFIAHVQPAGAPLQRLTGFTEGPRARLRLDEAGEGERALHARLAEAQHHSDQIAALRARTEACPVPGFEIDAAGCLAWHNRAATTLLGLVGGSGPATALLKGTDGALQMRTSDGTRLGWGRLTSAPTPGGGVVGYIEDIDAQVRAEEALDSFTGTLTDTFAHLATGLAIFDRERRLSLFNPALSDMFGLDPVPLAARPTLREFLEALRQRRMIPEQTDFTAWRRQLSARAEGSPQGLAEDWTLPSGRILRMNVRQHPRGAIAFVFEDISGTVRLERTYRTDIELAQATLDHLDEGVAVFGKSGEVLMTNAAFERIMDISAFATIRSGGIDLLLAAAEGLGSDPDVWQDFKRFALSDERAEEWQGLADFHTGCRLMLRASALPDGSTLLALSSGLHELVRRAASSGSFDSPRLVPRAI